jgi:DnaK suppressor protein
MQRKTAVEKLEEKLRKRAQELKKQVGNEMEILRDKPTGVADHGEESVISATGEISSLLATHEAQEILTIDRALRKIKEGNYGKCESCGKPIPAARLETLPFCLCCVKCQEERERLGTADTYEENGEWERVYEREKQENQGDDGSLGKKDVL